MIGTQTIPLPKCYKQMLPAFMQRTADVSFSSKRRLGVTNDEIEKAGKLIGMYTFLLDAAYDAWNESGGDKAYVAFMVRQVILIDLNQ